MTEIQTARLTVADVGLARTLFHTVASVFETEVGSLSDGYLTQLLSRPSFWAVAATVDGQVVGGLTAHTLPLTRAELSELFIFDIAVVSDWQRKGVGRLLMSTVRAQAAAAGILFSFVPADNEDTHALDFYRAIGGVPAAVTIFTFGEGGSE